MGMNWRSFSKTPRCRACVLGVGLAFFASGCDTRGAQRVTQADGATDIAIYPAAIQTEVKRLGINLGGQNFYDSGQMLRNLVYINPGFEGESWQSILRCAQLTATSCTDGNEWTQWPAGFLDGAEFAFISGPARGAGGRVTASDAADSHHKGQGVTIHFAALSGRPAVGDFVVVRKTIPGNAQAGWGTGGSDAQRFGTETTDLAANSPGMQALRISARAPGQWASLHSYFDSRAGHSFVQMHGRYRLSFRAKGLGGNDRLKVSLTRQIAGGGEVLFTNDVALTGRWRDYGFDFTAAETGDAIGTVDLAFNVAGAEVLLDDVSLVADGSGSGSAANTTAFRDEVVEALRDLHPGVLRYLDGDHLGSSIDNLIAPAMARVRAGYSEGSSQQNMIPVGLPEFLKLCQAVGAEPWFSMPAAISPSEMQHLIEYLSGPASSAYGAKRAASGQVAPWTSMFRTIHLELGNEEWNGVTFAGSAMPDAAAYGERAREVFTAARSSPSYLPASYDLVLGSFALIPDMTRQELAHSGGYDSTAVAPYLFNHLNDVSSKEAIFGPMFAAAEMIDSLPNGYMAQQAQVAKAAARPANLSVYEVNIGADSGSVPQASVDEAIPSLGAGLALVEHMLVMMRDLGIKTESIWSLAGYDNRFNNTVHEGDEQVKLFGVVVDMGGATNRRRPQFLAEQLANEAILPTMLGTRLTGANPTWHQPLSVNDSIQIDHAHELQAFAFADGQRRSLIVFNLSRTQARVLTFSGGAAPVGNVQVSQLTAKDVSDNNEDRNDVVIRELPVGSFQVGQKYSVPAYSMTSFRWDVGR
jgi:hypothetical protein